MADNTLQLVVDVDVRKGSAEVAALNQGLDGIGKQAVASAKMATTGIDGFTTGLGHSRAEVTEASHALHLLGGQIGLELPRAVRRFIAESQVLGGVLASVFKAS